MRLFVTHFQDNQKDLENATEQLSEYLERDITSDMLVDIKQKVQDKYRYTLLIPNHILLFKPFTNKMGTQIMYAKCGEVY